MKPECNPSTPPKRTSRPSQPTLVLYLRDVTGIPYTNDAAVAEAFAKDPAWKKIAETYGGTTKLAPQRAFKSNPDTLRRLIAKAEKNATASGVRGYRPLEFDHYFLVSIPKGTGKPPFDVYCDLKAAMQPRGGRVFLSMPSKRAQASNDYLGAATIAGIGAANLVSGVSGNAITGKDQVIVDIEKAWLTASGRVDVLPPSVPVQESADLGDMNHGTAVAGIVLGAGNVAAIGGIATQATFFKGACLDQTGVADPSQILASTILDAALELEKSPRGTGVLLIEQETWDSLPIESSPLEFAAIQQVAAAGHIVIEPAGNLGDNLSNYPGWTLDSSGEWIQRSLDPQTGGATSGAIVVAAGRSGKLAGDTLGERSPSSNHGNLVDCWAWGDSIATLGVTRNASGDPIPFADPAGFGGTSGAAAIVAGAVLLMQHMRAEANKAQLNPSEVRKLLLDLGTPGAGDLAGKNMPDLGDAKLRARLES